MKGAQPSGDAKPSIPPKSPTKMKIYTEVSITPHHAGFNMYQRGEIHTSPQTSFAFETDLLSGIAQVSDEMLPLEDALEHPEFIALEVDDIRGRIYNEPGKLFARISDGTLSYFGIVETDVEDDFFAA